MAQPFFPGSFFPGPEFGWTFSAVLFGLLAVAAYEDLKTLIIPKWITLPTLGLGFLCNMVRGGWVEASGGGVGSGFLFALAGFGTGFGMFLFMWLMGTCRGATSNCSPRWERGSVHSLSCTSSAAPLFWSSYSRCCTWA